MSLYHKDRFAYKHRRRATATVARRVTRYALPASGAAAGPWWRRCYRSLKRGYVMPGLRPAYRGLVRGTSVAALWRSSPHDASNLRRHRGLDCPRNKPNRS